jgi:hypothetical protein
MGKALVACLLLAACQGMYSTPAEGLKNPPRIKPDKTKVAATDDPGPAYIEDCTVDFTGTVAKKRKTPAAQKLVATANVSLQNVGPTTPTTTVTTQAAVDAIGLYRDALLADPYNAEATLKLALAYDRVLRKGCAIAMLKRLATLADSQNPALEAEAKPNVELVKQNDHWFRGYRPSALKAAGL